MTKIIKCDCNHKWQDKRYGKKRRMANQCEKGFRCTVCGKVEQVSRFLK